MTDQCDICSRFDVDESPTIYDPDAGANLCPLCRDGCVVYVETAVLDALGGCEVPYAVAVQVADAAARAIAYSMVGDAIDLPDGGRFVRVR